MTLTTIDWRWAYTADAGAAAASSTSTTPAMMNGLTARGRPHRGVRVHGYTRPRAPCEVCVQTAFSSVIKNMSSFYKQTLLGRSVKRRAEHTMDTLRRTHFASRQTSWRRACPCRPPARTGGGPATCGQARAGRHALFRDDSEGEGVRCDPPPAACLVAVEDLEDLNGERPRVRRVAHRKVHQHPLVGA